MLQNPNRFPQLLIEARATFGHWNLIILPDRASVPSTPLVKRTTFVGVAVIPDKRLVSERAGIVWIFTLENGKHLLQSSGSSQQL
jgi:hypothetical protein